MNSSMETDKIALVVIECQRGVVGDLSMLPALADAARPVLPAIGRLASRARSAGVHVLHLTYLPLAGGRSTSRTTPLMRVTSVSRAWTDSSPESQIVEEVGLGPNDIVLARHQGISPVHRTEALTILRNIGIEEIVIAGVSTNWAIPLVAAGATDEGFSVAVPTDAVTGVPAEHHRSMLEHSLSLVARLTTVDELISEWGA